MEQSAVMFILPMLATKLETIGGRSLMDYGKEGRPRMTRQFERSVETGFRKFDTKYVAPILSLEPKDVRKFVEENAGPSMIDMAELSLKFIGEFPRNEIQKFDMMIKKAVIQKLQSRKTLFNEQSLDKLADAISLELNNDVFLMNRYMNVFFMPELTGVLETKGLDPENWIHTMMKFMMTIGASLDIVKSGNVRLSSLLDELCNLSLEFAEDNDSTVTTMDILLNEAKRSSLERAYENFEKTLADSA